MPLLRRFSPALRAYIREEYRRVWTRREYLTLLLALTLVEVLRVVATWVAVRGQSGPGNSPTDLLNLVGLTSWVTYMGHFYAARAFTTAPGQWGFWIASEFLSLFTVLLPYYAGRSIAAVRKYRELDELQARGLEAPQILLGRGIAHLMPFLVVLVAGILVSVLQIGYFMSFGGGPNPYTSGVGVVIQLVMLVIITPLGSLARMGVLVCASALCRRVWSGVAVCYALFLLLYPGVTLAIRAAASATSGPVFGAASILRLSTIAPVSIAVFSFVLLAFFYRLALRALAGQPLVRLPKMDEPRNLWVEQDEPPASPAREA